MYGMPQKYKSHNRPVMIRPMRPRLKKRFHWQIIVIPAVILLFIWFTRPIEPAGTWYDFLNYIGINDKARFNRIAVGGIIVCTICIIVRILRDNKRGR